MTVADFPESPQISHWRQNDAGGTRYRFDDYSRDCRGVVQLDAIETMCSLWPAGPVDEDFREPLDTEAPVLLLSGEADPITPPEYADQVAAVWIWNKLKLRGSSRGQSQEERLGYLHGGFGQAIDAWEARLRDAGAEFKLDTVMEGVRGENSIAQICRERGITDSLYYKWRDQFYDRAVEIFTDGRQTAQQTNDLEDRNAAARSNGTDKPPWPSTMPAARASADNRRARMSSRASARASGSWKESA